MVSVPRQADAPIGVQQAEADADERQHEVETEQMPIRLLGADNAWSTEAEVEVQQVVDRDGERDD